MLRTQVNSVNTEWKDVITDFIEKNPDVWKETEEKYAKECEDFEGILGIYPKRENIFRCFKYFNPTDTRVVILGQDPYHGPNQAIGLCFGVPSDVKTPPSLRNIIKETQHPIEDTTLENWAKQGVLMLNASLTVRQGTPSSHMKVWANFTRYIIDWLAENTKDVVFVAWGAFAYSKMENVCKKTENNHSLLVSSHPSPLSYTKNFKEFPPFKNSNPLDKINTFLTDKKQPEINW